MAAPDATARILVVEDDSSQRTDVVDYLAMQGFSVEGVGTAATLRDAVVRRTPDVIVLDVGLPDADGFALARELRNDFTGGIVMLTAFTAPQDVIAGLDSGADVYLIKHASLREIDATIRDVLRRRQGR